jgi:hypothetical protein
MVYIRKNFIPRLYTIPSKENATEARNEHSVAP